ncbi:tetratricopeptide repeat protein [Tenacibaculum sp. MEBiC06402]|uniref:type IX secretion system periplasmic lipoprotein PorW/SprE n=1 Tax=unclassified Tenacibaculum TaxID=2635139 RepID=UPI003B9A5766
MKKSYNLFIFLIVASAIISCSTKKDSVINRNFHVLTTKYNVLFNGEQAFNKGLKDIENNYTDNFWKRLPIEPIKFDDKSAVVIKFSSPGSGFDAKGEKTAPLTPFDRAEEKAAKAIQKHSMNIKGYEKNRQIDDAYLLLGKSRYYTQRFIPAIEAFNYIIANYPKASLIYDTKVWRAKSNIRLENEKLAIESLKLLIELDKNEKNLTPVQRQQAYTAMAMAYEKTDTIQKVIDNLAISTSLVKNHQSARNAFVLGQIYSELNRKDSARMVFRKLADERWVPEKYRIHASIEMVKNIESKDSSNVLLVDRLRKLIRNSDNRKYLNELYYQAGVLQEDRGNTEKAIEYYLKSLEVPSTDVYQKTYAYEKLGNIYFEKQEYLLAGSFYDSVLNVTTEEFETEKRIRRIKRKNKGLTKLRSFEETVKNNDSILKIVAMSSDERTSFFESYIEKIKEDDEKKRQRLLNSQDFGSQFGGGSSFGGSNNQGKWYFYNTQSVGFGKVAFQKTWGSRTLEDNWRWSDKNEVGQETVTEDGTKTEKTDSRYVVDTYLKKIPSDPIVIATLKKERNDALYQLGLIYKEQFKNPELAIGKFETLYGINQNPDLILPINYHLYQLYKEIGEQEKASEKKDIILTNYSNSKFAEIIRKPDSKIVEEKKDDEIDKKYRLVYSLYKFNQFEDVVDQVDKLNDSAKNSELFPKFVLLRALAIGKYKSKEEYKKELEFVAFTFANRIEGKKAAEIIKLLK